MIGGNLPLKYWIKLCAWWFFSSIFPGQFLFLLATCLTTLCLWQWFLDKVENEVCSPKRCWKSWFVALNYLITSSNLYSELKANFTLLTAFYPAVIDTAVWMTAGPTKWMECWFLFIQTCTEPIKQLDVLQEKVLIPLTVKHASVRSLLFILLQAGWRFELWNMLYVSLLLRFTHCICLK